MSITLEQVHRKMASLNRIFDRFAIETRLQPRISRLGNINSNIGKLRTRLSKLETILGEDGDTIARVKKQGYELVEEFETRLRGYGLVEVARTRGKKGMKWIELETSKLTMGDSQDVVMVEREDWEGARRRSQQIAEGEGAEKDRDHDEDEDEVMEDPQAIVFGEWEDGFRRSKRIAGVNLQEDKENQHKITDVDAYMSDNDDCITTLVIDKTKTAAKNRFNYIVAEENKSEAEVDSRHISVVDDMKAAAEKQIESTVANEDGNDIEVNDGYFPVVDNSKGAEDNEVENETDRRKRGVEDSWIELGMQLKDELLWYDYSKDFNEDLLP